MVLHFSVQACQTEHDEQDVLVMQLDVLRQLVRAVRQKRLQTLHEPVDVTGFHICNEPFYLERRPGLADSRIERKQEIHEAFLYLPVRKP